MKNESSIKMKQLILLCIFLSSSYYSQIIKDTVLGRPKYVKEYVIFLNESRPYTFMSSDSEYGHAVIMTPKNLRNRMQGTWFETDFCRYINNETYYDKNRNITKETWYYKSGEIVDDYDYTFDSLNRLIEEKRKSKYSESSSHYFYNGNNKTPNFKEAYYKAKDEPLKKYVISLDNSHSFFITKYDTISKTDSIFAITNEIWKKVDKGYRESKDSIYHKKLSKVKVYNNQYKVVEEKSFNYRSDYQNKKISLNEHFKYEYDEKGNLVKKTDWKDGKFHYYTIRSDGKIIKEEKEDSSDHTVQFIFKYTKDGKLERETIYCQDKLCFDRQYEFKNNYIYKLLHTDKIGQENKIIEPTIITFRYSFDKKKNWTSIIKNVNGKDLYKWIRKIEYY